MSKTTIDTYIERQIELALDLLDTFDPLFEVPEQVATLADLHDFLREYGLPNAPELSEADLESMRRLSAALREVVEAEDDEMASERMNGLLEDARVTMSLVADAEGAWHIRLAAAADPDPVSRLATEAALGLALALQHHGRDRLRTCAADPCREVFIDQSRNRSRRFCSERCANRHNVAAFRERQRARDQG